MIGIVAKYRETQIVASGAGWVRHQETSSERSNAVCGFDVCFDKKTRLGIRMFRCV